MDHFQRYLDRSDRQLKMQLKQFRRGGIISLVLILLLAVVVGKIPGFWIFLGGLLLLALFQLRLFWVKWQQIGLLRKIYPKFETRWGEYGKLLKPFCPVRGQIEAENNGDIIGGRGISHIKIILNVITCYMRLYALIQEQKSDHPETESLLWGLLVYHKKMKDAIENAISIDATIFGKKSLLQHLETMKHLPGGSWLIDILNGYRSMGEKTPVVKTVLQNHFIGGRFRIISRDQFERETPGMVPEVKEA